LIDAVQNGDPEAAFNTIVTQAASATTAVLNGALDPNFGLVAGLQGLRKAIAAAITPQEASTASIASVAKVPTGAAKSFTVTAPLKEIAPAPKAGATSGEEATGSGAGEVGTAVPGAGTKDSSGEVTPTDNKENLKGGNLFVPGGTAAKGGRHRTDNGASFGQGLRDAAEKTVRGLTSLGHGGKSESSGASASHSAGGSGAGSSGSGGSGSGSGS
jgi:hypothetical protein